MMRGRGENDDSIPTSWRKNFTVQTQWDVLILFLALFVGGVALWLVMIGRYFFSSKLQAQ